MTELEFLDQTISALKTRREVVALMGSTAPVPVPAPAEPKPAIAFPGVNLAGGDFGDLGRPLGQGYIYPDDASFAYWASKGMKLIRLPFKIERIQPRDHGEFSPVDIKEIDRCVAAAGKAGLTIVLDAHNYGKRNDKKMRVEDLANLWWRLATRYKAQAHVAYGVMNEPMAWGAADWQAALREAVRAIRVTGAKGLILAPGSGWNGAHSFISSGNAAAFEGFSDSNYMIEVHQYLDGDSSGTHLQEYVAGKGATVLKPITDWARAKGHRLFLGEWGFAMPAGAAEAKAMLTFMSENADVWAAHAIWAAGPWWGDYPFSVEPRAGQDAPHLAVLTP